MKRSHPTPTLTLLLLLGASSSLAFAQPMPPDAPPSDDGPDGHRPPPPDGDGRGDHGPPRGHHRGGPKGRLDRDWHEVERLERGPDELSKAQAQSLVALVKPWSVRPTMSDTQAHELSQSIEGVLGKGQGVDAHPPRDDFGPPPPREGGRPPREGDGFGPPPSHDGGHPHQHGERTPPPPPFNPFYAPTGRADWQTLPSPMQQLLSRRYHENRVTLERLSRRAAK